MNKVCSSPVLRAALIVLTTLICYLPAFRAGLIWDDVELTDSPHMHEAGGLLKIWSGNDTPDYFPMTLTSFWVEARIWGGHAAGYHAVNILLHAGSAVLLWLILLRLGVPGAFFAGLLFAVHPVCVASVAWIAERKNTLSLFFCFASLLCWVSSDGKKERARAYILISLVAFLLALLSKTSVVMLPFALLMLTWWRNGRITRNDLLRAAPFFAASLLLGIVTINFQHHALADVPHEALALKVARIGWAVGFYAGKIFWPSSLCLVYPIWNLEPSSLVAWLPVALLVVFFAVLVLSRKDWARHILMGAGYFVVMLAPVSGIIWMNFLKQSWVADWWQYPAMPGLVALFAAGCAFLYKVWGRVVVLPCALIIAGMGVLTWQEAETYKTLEISCRHTLALNPRAWGIRNNLARELVAAGHIDEAVALFREGLALDSHDVMTLDNLVRTLLSAGRWGDAFPYCREIVELNPNYAAGHVSFGVALAGLRHFDDASTEFYQAVKLQPGKIDYRLKLIRSLALAGRLDAAAEEVQNTLKAMQLTGRREGMDELKAMTGGIEAARKKREFQQVPAAAH